MNDSGHLHLVFSETGNDPLVLESSWTGVNRERPNLKNIRQAKPRLRALSILLLLAKYQEICLPAACPPQTFQVAIEKHTWICTLANDLAGVKRWVKERFHLYDHNLFLDGDIGTTHMPGGQKYPSMEFLAANLPLVNLHLSVKLGNSPNARTRPLEGEDLLALALKIESQHWKKSAIKLLYPELAAAENLGKLMPDDGSRKLARTENALFMSFAADVLRSEPDHDAARRKGHYKQCFRALMEREIEAYRSDCEPLFAYIKSRPISIYMPYDRIWNQGQIEVLRINCFCYDDASGLGLYYFLTQPDLHEIEIIQICFSSHGPHTSADAIFNRLLEAYKSVLETADYDYERWVLPEFKRLEDSLLWGLRNTRRPIMVGALLAHQVCMIDFFEKVCLPFGSFRPEMAVHADVLRKTVLKFKNEAAENGHLVPRFCELPKDFNDAWQAGKQLLAAQAAFLRALHRRLVTLEG